LTDSTISACLKNWHESTKLPKEAATKLRELVTVEIRNFPPDGQSADELMASLDAWLGSSNSRWPENLAGANPPWGKEKRQILAMNYLGVRKGVKSVADSLIALDALFQCQANLPSRIEQGTVFRTLDDKFLICITPACDCDRPSRINNYYMFLEATKLEKTMLKNYHESNVVTIRTKNNEYILLGVSPKPTVTYKISEPSIDTVLFAYATFESKTFFPLMPAAQLRPSRVQSLISLTAGKVIEVGLDRSELLRQLCKANK
jgi:hypothetical protein